MIAARAAINHSSFSLSEVEDIKDTLNIRTLNVEEQIEVQSSAFVG
jgi:hypothetical protein